jgi:hypothetical protein
VACACTFLAVLSFLLVVAAHALTHARADLLARACTRIRARLRMHTCGHTPTSAEKAPGPRTPRARRRCPTRSPIAPPPLAMARTCTRFPAAERRQQHARRKDKARRLTQVPWAESRRPLAQTTALPHRMGPERPMLAMTVQFQFLPFYFKDTGLRDPSPRLTPRSGSNKAEGPHWWHWLWACRCPGSPLSGQPTAARRPPERATSSLSALSLAVSRET